MSRDWELVHYPKCPKCGEANQPRQSAMIERVREGVYACSTCGTEWKPAKG